MSPVLIGVLGLLGAVVTGGFGYLIARRNTSGRVNTTDAAKLWDESNAMRQELRDEVVALRGKVDNFEGQVAVLNTLNAELRGKHEECQRNEALLRDRLDRLEGAVERRRRSTTPRKRT